MTQRISLGRARYLLACALVLLFAACGGGPGEVDVHGTTTAIADKASEIVARTGPIVAVRVGETAYLSDNNSFTSSTDPMSLQWAFAAKPETSKAVLQGPTSANPSFVADARGTYAVQLVVSAGNLSSQRAIQLVVATIDPERVTGEYFHQGLSSSCQNCHNDEQTTRTAKSGNHIATSNLCETCHTPLGWLQTPFVDHQEVSGSCSQCHNNDIAIGKSDFHSATNAECDDCHNTTSFLALNADGSFDHSGIIRACSGCHNGTVARGTPSPPDGTHPDTDTDCGFCHTTDTFLGAFPDHNDPNIVGPAGGITCASCHVLDGSGSALGHPGHPDTSTFDCSYCHGIVTFSLDAFFNHGLVDPAVIPCATCHNDSNTINAIGATPTPPHPARTDCASCHSADNAPGTNARSFAYVSSFDHTGVTTDCAQSGCHTGLVGEASGMHTNHLPTGEDCSVCHTPGAFSTGVFTHGPGYLAPTNQCADCHDDVITGGKLPSHFPTPLGANQDCADCHNTTDFTSGPPPFDHLNIDPNNCMTCHNGNFDTTGNTLYGKPGTHLPVSQDCSVCHTTSVPFWQVTNFGHPGITNNCESCHGGNPDYVAVGAIGKKAFHIPAVNQCLTCHIDTSSGGFASPNRFLSNVHANYTNGCEGCHVSRFLAASAMTPAGLIKDANHLPTSQDCDVCHTVAGFAPPTNFAHIGITGNCTSCHDGTYDPDGPTNPSGPSGKAADLSGHVATSADCGSCHGTDSFLPAFAIDHSDPAVLLQRCDDCHNGTDATGTSAKTNPAHIPIGQQDCRVCHLAGVAFKPAVFNHTGIVDNCASCHNGTDATGLSAKPNHINIGPPDFPVVQDCSVCHNPTAFANATFDHQGISDNCGNCHDGYYARGRHTNHVPTNDDCVVCHQTTGFKPATFSHAGIVDNCASCHAAGFATPKKVGHVATNQDCGVCHTPSAFKPASFDHTGIVDNCASCHDGNTAKGKMDAVPQHLETGLDCHFCHTTATFVGGSWTHDANSANNCDTCHSPGNGATPKPGGHLSTTEQCDKCHTTNGWAPTNFSHDPNGNYPGNHRRDPGCNGCHGPTISASIPWPFPQYAPFCAACHANDFRRKGKHIGGENGTVAQNKDCSGGGRGCHKVSDSGF
ncbi:MAG: hypothetical protein OER87_06965 [Gammaproteobacteria bacterium]|nr:hypothetical protein [Gammaproteobacteria bacterium]